MIRYDPKSWVHLILHSYSRHVFRALVPAQIFMTLYTSVLVFVIRDYFKLDLGTTTFVHSLLGIVLGLFLVFRVNSAYDRWWEGRVMWGKLVNDTRNFAHKLRSFLSSDSEDERQFFLRKISLYAESLKEHLRKEPDFESIQIEKSEDKEMFLKSHNKPNYVRQ